MTRSRGAGDVGTRQARATATGLALATASGLCFSVSTVLGQAALEHGMNPSAVAGARLAVGATLLWCCVALLRPALTGIRRSLRLMATGTLTAVQVPLLFEAVDRLGSSMAILLLFSYPSIVAVIAVVSGRERMTSHKAVAVGLALAGTLLVIGADDARITVAGVLFGLGSGLALALYITAADRSSEGVDPFTATAWIQLGAVVAVTPLVLGRGGGLSVAEVPGWTILIGVASGGAALFFIMAVSRVTPTIASVSTTVEPIATAALAVLLLDDSLKGRQLLGGALIVSAVVVAYRAPRADLVSAAHSTSTM